MEPRACPTVRNRTRLRCQISFSNRDSFCVLFRYRISGIRVSLDLQNLSDDNSQRVVRDLLALDLSSCRSISVDVISSYVTSPALQRLTLDNTCIASDIVDLLSKKFKLRELSAVGCSLIHGDVSGLVHLPLRSFDIRMCSLVTGSLSSLAPLGGTLTTLCLDRTVRSLSVSASRSYFAISANEIQPNNPCGYQSVTGCLDTLAPNLPLLTTLRLAGLRVNGRLSSLAHCSQLTFVDLAETGVIGRLEVCVHIQRFPKNEGFAVRILDQLSRIAGFVSTCTTSAPLP